MDAMTEDRIRRSIFRTLEAYPNISAAMLGLYVRPYNRNWHIVLNTVVEEGYVIKEPVRGSTSGAMRYRLRKSHAA